MSHFQRRQYITIASIISGLPADIRPLVARHFAIYFKTIHEGFDKDLFISLCLEQSKPSNPGDEE